jgi:hypothetical protein
MYRSYRAVIATYVVVLVVCFLSAAPAWPISGHLMGRAEPGMQKLLHVIASVSPLQAMLSVVMPQSDYTVAGAGMPPYWQLFIPISILVTLITAAITLYKLHQPLTDPQQREKLKVIERGQITARTFLFIVDPRKRKRMIRWWQNPMLMKEFRTRPMLQTQWLLRAVGICLIVSVLLMILVSVSLQAFVAERAAMIPMMTTVVAGLMVVLVMLIGPSLAGGTISADRETGIWSLMRTTRMSSWQIVVGKFQSSVIPLLLFALATLPALLILLYFNVNLWQNVVRICYVIGMTILVVSTAGMFFSSIFARTATATAWTYAVVVGIGLLTLLVLLGEELLPHRLVETIFLVNPVAAAMDAAGHPTMHKYDLWISHLKIMAIATIAMFAVTTVRVHQLRRPE